MFAQEALERCGVAGGLVPPQASVYTPEVPQRAAESLAELEALLNL